MPKWLTFTLKRGSMFLQNYGIHLSDYNVSLPRRPQYKSAALCTMFHIHICFFKINQCPSSPIKQQSLNTARNQKGCNNCIYNRTVCVTEEETQFSSQDTGIVTTFMTFIWEILGSNLSHVTDNSEFSYGIFLNLSSKSSSEFQIDLNCLLLNL
jgi:hypothetical protein